MPMITANYAGMGTLGAFTQDFLDFSLSGEIRVPLMKPFFQEGSSLDIESKRNSIAQRTLTHMEGDS